MVGPTAQLVALACHLNGRRRGVLSPFFPDNSTCTFCEYMHFIKKRSGATSVQPQWDTVATTPDEWIEKESKSGRRALVLHRAVDTPGISDRMSAGFVGGGGQWLIALADEASADVWSASWRVGNQKAPDRRIWQVAYGLVGDQVPLTLPASRPINTLRNVLGSVLNEIEAFARRLQRNAFAECFAKAGLCISADDPAAMIFYKDLAPPGILPHDAAQLLAACQVAWVFGGMGSWNDQIFEGHDGKEYDRLSAALFGLLNESICAAANASASSRA